MKTLFNDPLHWAEKAVGTNLRFYFMLICQILGGICLFVDRGNFILITVIVVIFPFCYLFALRAALKELKKTGTH